MIIRKPFKFLIEHFKIINAILILLTIFVGYKFFNIMQFFGNFVTNSYTTTETNLASTYVGVLLPIVLIVIILINIIIFILFRSKDKDTKIYIISTIFFAILLVFSFVYRGVLENFEFNTVESQTALLYRDTAKFTFYPIFIFLIFQEEYDYITNLSACYLLSDNAAEGASSLEKYKVIVYDNDFKYSQVIVMKYYIIMVHY